MPHFRCYFLQCIFYKALNSASFGLGSAVSNRNINIAAEYTGMNFISVSYKGSLAVDGLGLL